MALRSYQYQIQAVVIGTTVITKSVTHSAVVSQSAKFGDFVEVESTLGIEGFTFAITQLSGTVFVTQDNIVTHLAELPLYPRVESTLDLDSSALPQFPISRSREEPLGLISTASVSQEFAVLAESDLSLTSVAAKSFVVAATTVISFTQDTYRSFPAVNDNVVTQVAVFGFGYDALTLLSLTTLATKKVSLNRGAATQNVVTQSSTYFIESKCNKKRQLSFDGTGAVPAASAKLNYRSDFVMVSLDDGEKLVLRNPETDDRRRYAFNRVNRSFYDGTADVYSDPSWVTEQTQIYTIIANKRESLESLFAFTQGNLGREILIKDWRGVAWIVILTNPGDLYTEDGEGYWTVNFEVVGEAVDGEYVVDHLGITDGVSRAGSEWSRSGNDTEVVTHRSFRQPYPLESAITFAAPATFTIV